MPPEASWTAIRSPRTSTRGVGFLPAALLPGTPCTGGNFPLPICWVCRLESVYGIARQFLSDEGVRRSRLGVDPGGRVAGEPLENCQKTAGGHWPLGCVLPGAWRVSKPQATGGRRRDKRGPWGRSVPGGCEHAGWLELGHAGVGESCCVARLFWYTATGLHLLPAGFFTPPGVNCHLAETAIHPSFFYSFWPLFALFSAAWIFGCSLSVWVSLRFASMFSPFYLVSTVLPLYTREKRKRKAV